MQPDGSIRPEIGGVTDADEKCSAAGIASDINTFNDQRKKLDHDITEEAIRHINQSELEPSKKTTVLFNANWHKGVIGIVASRLTESFYRPTIILTESNGLATGSAGRSKVSICITLSRNAVNFWRIMAGINMLPD